jgi:GST-like protein
MAIFPWLRSWKNQGVELADYPHVQRWFDLVAARPAVHDAVRVLIELRKPLTDDKARDTLFGNTQYQRH